MMRVNPSGASQDPGEPEAPGAADGAQARDRAAVLQGIVRCGRCGHTGVEYKNGTITSATSWHAARAELYANICQPHLRLRRPGLLRGGQSAELAALMQAKNGRLQADEAFDRAEVQQIERLRYRALLAERQCDALPAATGSRRCATKKPAIHQKK